MNPGQTSLGKVLSLVGLALAVFFGAAVTVWCLQGRPSPEPAGGFPCGACECGTAQP
jgi:hypothetical protein